MYSMYLNGEGIQVIHSVPLLWYADRTFLVPSRKSSGTLGRGVCHCATALPFPQKRRIDEKPYGAMRLAKNERLDVVKVVYTTTLKPNAG
jgi:hypothetical protein